MPEPTLANALWIAGTFLIAGFCWTIGAHLAGKILHRS
jgi:hypothetical protein